MTLGVTDKTKVRFFITILFSDLPALLLNTSTVHYILKISAKDTNGWNWGALEP